MGISADKDLRGMFGPIRDQDPRPTCMAFAASDAHAATRPAWQELSAEWAYYHALKRDKTMPHVGATMTSMLAGIEGDGQPEEAGWPYIAQLFTNLANWVPPAAKPLFHSGSTLQTATVKNIVACLDADQPVLFTMSLSDSFYTPDSNGLISGVEPEDPDNRHAVIAVGHSRNAGGQLILVRNSWGLGWGLDGHGWLAGSYLEPRLLRAATMIGDV
jgi:C1A family cysteine protease